MAFESENMKPTSKIIMVIVLFVFVLIFINFSNSFPDWISDWELELLNSVVLLLGISGMVIIATR